MSEILRRDIVRGLKKPRSGWPIRGIEEAIAETVFLHVKKVVRAARIYAKIHPELDGGKLLEMALYHDIAEYKEKDYLPGEITLEEKHRREKAVIEKLRDHFHRGGRIYEIWMEYEDRKTPEAIAVKQLDIMDTAVQALHYARLGYEGVHDFFPWAQEKLQDPLLVKIWNILIHSHFECDIFEQYFLLLELEGDEESFYHIMNSRLENGAQ